MSKEGDAQALQNMIRTEGWQLVEKYIRDRIEDNTNRMMKTEVESISDLKDIIKYQAEAKALKSVLVHINQTIQEGMNEE